MYDPVFKSKGKFPKWFERNLKRFEKEKHLVHKNYKINSWLSSFLYFSELCAKCKYFSKRCYERYLCKVQDNFTSNLRHFQSFIKGRSKSNLIGNINLPEILKVIGWLVPTFYIKLLFMSHFIHSLTVLMYLKVICFGFGIALKILIENLNLGVSVSILRNKLFTCINFVYLYVM